MGLTRRQQMLWSGCCCDVRPHLPIRVLQSGHRTRTYPDPASGGSIRAFLKIAAPTRLSALASRHWSTPGSEGPSGFAMGAISIWSEQFPNNRLKCAGNEPTGAIFGCSVIHQPSRTVTRATSRVRLNFLAASTAPRRGHSQPNTTAKINGSWPTYFGEGGGGQAANRQRRFW